MSATWITQEFTQRFAGSLIHFLWQGSLIAVLTAVCLRLLARKTAEWRYAASCAALAAMVASPVITFIFYAQTGAVSLRLLRLAGYAMAETQSAVTSASVTAWANGIVIVWSAGVLVGSARMAIGWIGTRRLLASGGDLVPDSVYSMFQAIATWMSIGNPARLLVHSGIDAPSVIGWLRPVVLMPISAITRLDEEQLRAVLAHELAHIRRHDFLVNAVQRFVEAILFYHPAVWWVSARVRLEREHCCDDLAVRLCGDRLTYAEALLELERNRESEPDFSVAATATGLKNRIHRILQSQSIPYEWHPVPAVAFLIVLWAVVGSLQSATISAVPRVLETPVALASPMGASRIPMAKLPLATALSAITAIVTAEQTAAPVLSASGASIEGVVVKAGTSEGLAGANVELTQLSATGSASTPRLLVSGPDGKFVFSELAEGGYRLVADLPSSEYQPGEYGQKTPRSRGTTIRLAASQKIQNARIEMVRTGAVAGRITNARGEPSARVRVVAMEMTYRDGEPFLNILQAVQTDDLGQYRLFWLSPGKYYVGARTADSTRKTTMVQITAPGRTSGYEEISSPVIRRKISDSSEFEETDRMVYYGNTPDPLQAVGIDVASGSTRSGIDISTATGVTRALRVRGVVVSGAGAAPSQPVSIRLVPRSWTADTIIPNTTTDSQGFFEVSGVTPGSYVLYASAQSASGALSGRLPIAVTNGDMEKLQVTIATGAELTGRVTINGDETKTQLPALRISLVRDPDILGLPQVLAAGGNRGGAAANGAIAADGSFRLQGVGVGDYRLNIAGLPKGAYIQSAQAEQGNVLATGIHIDTGAIGPIQVRLGTDPGKIEGAAVNERRDAVSNAVVVLVPDAALRRQKDLYKVVATDLLGRFTIEDVPPGNYKLFVWDYVPDGAWENETFMRTVESRGKSITVTPKSATTVDGLTVLR